TMSYIRTYGEGLDRGQIAATPTLAEVRVVGTDGLNQARITADDNTVTLFSATNGQRYLKLNETGIWIETGGKSYNREETATVPAPELLPFAVSTGWNTQRSPLGSVLVTPTTSGRHCQSRVRF